MGLKFERGYLLTKSVHIQVGRVLCFSDNSRARCPGIVYGFLEEYSPLQKDLKICEKHFRERWDQPEHSTIDGS